MKIIVNFKTYRTATGQQAVDLAKVCEKVSKDTGTDIIVVVQNIDLFRVSSSVSIPVYSEHMDPIKYGANTGKVLPEAILDNGGSGVIINHSEDRTDPKIIKEDLDRARNIGLSTIVCAATAEECKKIAKLSPDMVAVEPPELIGGDLSISKANPKLISDTVWLTHEVNKDISILCGAGIKDGTDVKIAKDLGCEGILIASGVTKAKNPEEALKELISKLK